MLGTASNAAPTPMSHSIRSFVALCTILLVTGACRDSAGPTPEEEIGAKPEVPVTPTPTPGNPDGGSLANSVVGRPDIAAHLVVWAASDTSVVAYNLLTGAIAQMRWPAGVTPGNGAPRVRIEGNTAVWRVADDGYAWYRIGTDTIASYAPVPDVDGAAAKPTNAYVNVGATLLAADLLEGSATLVIREYALGSGNAPREIARIPATTDGTMMGATASKVVWFAPAEGANGKSLVLYDRGTRTSTRLTLGAEPTTDFVFSGDHIAYIGTKDGRRDLYLYDVNANTEKRITPDNASDPTTPDLSGGRVFWTDKRNGNFDLFMYDIAQQSETRLTSNSAEDIYPAATGGDRLVWVRSSTGGAGQLWSVEF